MNINDYQDQAGKTAIFKEEDALLYTILVCFQQRQER